MARSIPVHPRDASRGETGLQTAEHAAREERVRRIERLTESLDEAFRIPGTNIRVGWDSIVGLIPGVGDLATAGFALYIVDEARKLGVSRWTLARMLANVGVDAVVGLIPVLGDVFDVAFKANRRNARLLRRRIDAEARKRSSTRVSERLIDKHVEAESCM